MARHGLACLSPRAVVLLALMFCAVLGSVDAGRRGAGRMSTRGSFRIRGGGGRGNRAGAVGVMARILNYHFCTGNDESESVRLLGEADDAVRAASAQDRLQHARDNAAAKKKQKGDCSPLSYRVLPRTTLVWFLCHLETMSGCKCHARLDAF